MLKTTSIKGCRGKKQENNNKSHHVGRYKKTKHMQDANWVYYPFKNCVFYTEQFPFKQRQTVLARMHEL